MKIGGPWIRFPKNLTLPARSEADNRREVLRAPRAHLRAGILLIAAASIICLMPAASFADRVEYTDGRIMEGQILQESDDWVVMRNGEADMRIPRSRIRHIVYGSEADHWLISAKASLARGEISTGLRSFAQAADEGVDPVSLAGVLIRYAAEISLMVPELDAAGLHHLDKVLEATREAELPLMAPLDLTRARLYLVRNNIDEAKDLLARAQTDHPREFELYRPELVNWFDENIDRALEAGRYSHALDLLMQMRQFDSERASDKRILLVLQWARGERDQGRPERAIDIYATQLMPLSEPIALNRINDTLEHAARIHSARRTYSRAIELYEKYGMKYLPETSVTPLADLYTKLGDDHLENGRLREARWAYTRADSFAPGSVNRQLFRVEFVERRQSIAEENLPETYKLAEWALERGLQDEARELFTIAAADDRLRPTAWAHIRNIEYRQAEIKMQELLDLYEKMKYADVLQGLIELRKSKLTAGLRQQVDSLEQLTQDAMRLAASEHPQQGEVLWQQAERAWYSGNQEEAASIMLALMTRFGDTPAGKRAEQFYGRVRNHLDLDAFERGRYRNLTRGARQRQLSGAETALGHEIQRLRQTLGTIEIDADPEAVPVEAREDAGAPAAEGNVQAGTGAAESLSGVDADRLADQLNQVWANTP